MRNPFSLCSFLSFQQFTHTTLHSPSWVDLTTTNWAVLQGYTLCLLTSLVLTTTTTTFISPLSSSSISTKVQWSFPVFLCGILTKKIERENFSFHFKVIWAFIKRERIAYFPRLKAVPKLKRVKKLKKEFHSTYTTTLCWGFDENVLWLYSNTYFVAQLKVDYSALNINIILLCYSLDKNINQRSPFKLSGQIRLNFRTGRSNWLKICEKYIHFDWKCSKICAEIKYLYIVIW